MVFHWGLSDSKSPQVSRTLLSILAVIIVIVIIIIIIIIIVIIADDDVLLWVPIFSTNLQEFILKFSGIEITVIKFSLK